MLNGGFIALFIVVMLKSALFAYMAPISKRQAFVKMVWANVISTIPGMLIAAFFSTPIVSLFGIPLFLFIGGLVCSRAMDDIRYTSWKWLNPNRFAVYGAFTAFISAGLATSLGLSAIDSIYWYFGLKFLYLFIGLMVSIPFTIMIEGIVVLASTTGGENHNQKMLDAVIRANLWTFFIIFLIGAIVAIPIRMRRSDFLMLPWQNGK